MNKIRIVLIVILSLSLISAVVFFGVGFFRNKVAGVYVDTNPASSVWINNEEVGRTPYKNTHSPDEIVIKLIPDSFQIPLAPYETKINLVEGVETVVRHDFGNTEETSSGEIISFDKTQKQETSLVVVSIPDSAQLVIDESERAFTPHKTTAITAGEHRLTLSAQGYLERKISVRTHQGYKLTAVVRLAKSQDEPEVQDEIQEEVVVEETKKEVEILSTPTGFLRVRNEPSTLGTEVARVEPENKYPLVEVDEKTGWYKIEYEKGKEGWISNQYAKEVGSETKVSPTPTQKKSTPTPRPTL